MSNHWVCMDNLWVIFYISYLTAFPLICTCYLASHLPPFIANTPVLGVATVRFPDFHHSWKCSNTRFLHRYQRHISICTDIGPGKGQKSSQYESRQFDNDRLNHQGKQFNEFYQNQCPTLFGRTFSSVCQLSQCKNAYNVDWWLLHGFHCISMYILFYKNSDIST